MKHLYPLLILILTLSPLFVAFSNAQPTPCDPTLACFDVKLGEPALIGDFYIDNVLVASGVNGARLTGKPGVPHLLAAKNIKAPNDQSFGDLYGYPDQSVFQTTNAGWIWNVSFFPAKTFLKGTLRVVLLPATLTADIFVDGALAASQANAASLSVAGGSHTVEGRNFKDSDANGRYTFNDLAQTTFTTAGVTITLYMQPVKIFPTATTTAPAPAATTPTAASPVIRAPSNGSFGGFELGGQVASFSRPQLMKDAGMTWVKRQVSWNPGDSARGSAGEMINEAHARGFKILLSVRGAPDLTTPDRFPSYASFVGDLAALGADAIEVWNEMNLDREWQAGKISPQAYVPMLQQSYAAIKAKNPGTMVISGAPSPTGYFGGCRGEGCDDQPYLEGMVAAGALNYADCVGIHYNEGIVSPAQTGGDPRGNPNHYTRYYQTMVDVYWAAIGGKRPLCFTELGYLSGQEWGFVPGGFLWRAPYNLTVAEHARFLAEAAQLSRAQGKVRMMIVFNVDFTTWTDDPQAGFAMLRPDGSCPACATLANVMR